MTLVQDEEEHEHVMKLFDKDGKESGTLVIKTKFIYVPPDPEPNPALNRNCFLKLKIVDVTTFKDADTFGKQDPFIRFKYDDEWCQTKVADNAGKHATFNEEFELPNVMQEIRQEELLILEALDEDTVSNDLLGQTNPLSYSALTQEEGAKTLAMDLYDKNYKHIGNLNIVTQYVQ